MQQNYHLARDDLKLSVWAVFISDRGQLQVRGIPIAVGQP